LSRKFKKNSSLDNEVIIHVNEGNDATFQYIKDNNYLYTFSERKLGLCSSVNKASKKSTKDFIIYAHDDMYFCQNGISFKKEISKLNNNLFIYQEL